MSRFERGDPVICRPRSALSDKGVEAHLDGPRDPGPATVGMDGLLLRAQRSPADAGLARRGLGGLGGSLGVFLPIP
jgi:hypothetical protein